MTKHLLSFAALATTLFVGLTCTAKAADNLIGSTQIFPSAPSSSAAPVPSTSGAGFFIPSISVGYPAAGSPCYGGLTGCSNPQGTIAVPIPRTVLANGKAYLLTIQFQSSTYSGTPVVVATILQNGTLIGGGHVTFSSPFGPDFVGYATFSGTLPSTTGSATILVDVLDPVLKISLATGVSVVTID